MHLDGGQHKVPKDSYLTASVCNAVRVGSTPLPPTLSVQMNAKQPSRRRLLLAGNVLSSRTALKMGSVSLKDLLDQGQTDEVVGKMKVLAVLESLPGLGKAEARRVMDEVGISDTRRVQGLGDQQRRKLLEKLG